MDKSANTSGVWARYSSAQILYQQGNVDKAEQEYVSLINFQKDFAWGYHGLAELYRTENRLDEALEQYQQVISLDPNIPWSHFGIGNIYLKQQRFSEAVKQFSKVVASQPKAMWAHQQLAVSLEALGDQQKAIAAYETAAYFFEKAGNFQHAISIQRRIIELNESNALAFYNLARLLDREDNWREAVTAYETAIQLNPNFFDTYRKLISVLQHHSQINEAIKICEALIKLEPNFYWNYGVLADLLFSINKKPEALKYYEKSVEIQIKTLKPNIGYQNWDKSNTSEKQVHFFIIGFAKTATTSLYQYLVQHPQVLPPYRKEPHFFSKFIHYGMDWYLSQFPTTSSQNKYITGEGSINYIENKFTPKRIYKKFPKAKLFVVLREPVQRTISDYYMWLRDGRENRSLEDVVDFELSKLEHCTPVDLEHGNHWRYFSDHGFVTSYLLRSLYLYPIRRWMKVFPREQFFIVETQQLANDPQQVMSQIFTFLEISECQEISYRKYNKGTYYTNDELTQRLADFFRPHNRLLEEFLGFKLNWTK